MLFRKTQKLQGQAQVRDLWDGWPVSKILIRNTWDFHFPMGDGEVRGSFCHHLPVALLHTQPLVWVGSLKTRPRPLSSCWSPRQSSTSLLTAAGSCHGCVPCVGVRQSEGVRAYKVPSYYAQGETMLTIFVNPSAMEVLVGFSDAAPFARVGPRVADVWVHMGWQLSL